MNDQERMMRADGYVSAADACRAIGLSYVGNVHRMIKLGQLDGVQVGTHWYVLVKSLLERYAASPTIVRSILDLGVEAKAAPGMPAVVKTKPAKSWPSKRKAARR